MDLITQALLGASVAQLGFQKTLGKKAVAWGAIIGMFPDIDVLVKFSSNPFAEIIYHRGITHALWFGPVLGPLIGYFIWKHYRAKGHNYPLMSWSSLAIWSLITHPLLDVFTVYGTQLLAPFSNYRFSFPAIAIIDPIYSIILLISIAIGLFLHKRNLLVTVFSGSALLLTSAYLFWGLAQNSYAEALGRSDCQTTSSIIAVKAYPTIFQLFWRRVVIEDEDNIRIGFVSTWSPKPINWQIISKPRNIPTLNFLHDPEVEIFKWFADQQYILRYNSDLQQVILTDSRFGFQGPSIFGLWGILIKIDAQGNKNGTVEMVKYVPDSIQVKDILRIFYDAFK